MNADNTPNAYFRFRKRRSPAHRAAVAFLALGCATATYVATIDVLDWQQDAATARSVAGNQAADEKERREAIVCVLRNVRASVDCLREIAKQQDALGEQARLALRHIDESLR